jgi:hypothetical protein
LPPAARWPPMYNTRYGLCCQLILREKCHKNSTKKLKSRARNSGCFSSRIKAHSCADLQSALCCTRAPPCFAPGPRCAQPLRFPPVYYASPLRYASRMPRGHALRQNKKAHRQPTGFFVTRRRYRLCGAATTGKETG